jgi:hypothetical protein
LRGVLVVLVFFVAACATPSLARAGSNLFVGFSDDGPKWNGAAAAAPARAAGASSFRVTLRWASGRTDLTAQDISELANAVSGTSGLRLVLAVYGWPTGAPQNAASRTQFCTYARNAVARFPSINDVVIWNEPNLNSYWRPQFNPDKSSAAPAVYEALLARCWDVLHAFRPSINVIGPVAAAGGNDNPDSRYPSHSPVRFIREMGAAFRASGRMQRLFDTFGQHVYQSSTRERPFFIHPSGGRISEGESSKLVQKLQEAFGGTAQPVPGPGCDVRCIPIWYLESGFQTTVPPSKAVYYTGTEGTAIVPLPDFAGGEAEFPNPSPLSTSLAPDQATQLRYAVRLAYCQPYVGAIFNFLLRDDAHLSGWQSGVLWADGTRKASFAPLASVVADVKARRISCAPPTPPTGVAVGLSGDPPKVTLSWGASASQIGVSGYEVLRDGVSLGRTRGLTYVDASAAPGATHSYSVRGYDAAGGTGKLAAPVVSPPAPPPPPPPPPPPVRHRRSVPRNCVVPNVRGKTLRKAAAAIRASSCRVGRVRYVRARKRRGVVVSQAPKPGTRLRHRGRVKLVISRRHRR